MNIMRTSGLCLTFICEYLFTIHIMSLMSTVCLSFSSGIPGIKLRTADSAEDNSAYPEYRAVVGDRVQLPCNITIPSKGVPITKPLPVGSNSKSSHQLKDDSITLILWYRGDTTGAPIYTVDARQNELQTTTNHETTKHFLSDDLLNRAQLNISVRPAILTIDPVRGEDEGEYRCRVDFRWGRTSNTVVSLIVIVPPRKIIIKNEKLEPLEELAGPYQEDTDVRLTCEAKGARPPAVVHWYRNNVMIDDTFQVIQEGSRVRNELLLTKVNRTDLFCTFVCQAFNTNHSLPIEAKVVLDINLRPLNVEIAANSQPLIAGRKIDVICQSSGSRPLAQITWFKSKRKIMYSSENYSEDGNTTRSVISLTPVPDDNGLQLVCLAHNPRIDNSSIEDSITLNVLYEPRVSLLMATSLKNSVVAEGNEVLMDCKTKANPPVVEYNWYYEERLIKSDSLKGIFVNNASLIIKNVSRGHNGKYYCLASNSVGRGKSNDVLLTVDYAPLCKPGQKIVYGIGLGETAKILCDVDSRPPQVLFHWTFNDTHNQNLKYISEGLRSSLSYTPKTRAEYGFVSCRAKNVVGNQQIPCVYTIIPAGKPEPPETCEAYNIGFTSFSINCNPGYDGGLQQSFCLEVYQQRDDKLVLNLTKSRVSSFELSALQPNTDYNIKVFAFNVKGKSEPFAFTTKTLVPAIPPTVASQSEEWGDLTHNLVILAVILILIAILIAMICKILHKIRENMSEDCDEEEADNKSEESESLQYVDNTEDNKPYVNYRTHNGVLPQEFTQLNQTNCTTTSDYLMDRNKINPGFYEVYEIELPTEECNQYLDGNSYVDYNNQRGVGYQLTTDFDQWSPNVSKYSSQIELSYPATESIPRHETSGLFYNHTLNPKRSAHRTRKYCYTSTPV